MSILTRGFMFGDLQSMKKGLNANIVINNSKGDFLLYARIDESANLLVATIDTGNPAGFNIPFSIPFDIPRVGLQTASLDLMQYPEFYQIQFYLLANEVGRKEVRQLTVQAFPEATDFRGKFQAT